MKRVINGLSYNTETEARTWCEDHQINADLIARYFTIEEA